MGTPVTRLGRGTTVALDRLRGMKHSLPLRSAQSYDKSQHSTDAALQEIFFEVEPFVGDFAIYLAGQPVHNTA